MKRRGAPPLYPLPLSSIIAGLDLGTVRPVRACGWFLGLAPRQPPTQPRGILTVLHKTVGDSLSLC